MKQRLFKSDEDVLEDALDFVDRMLAEYKVEQLWSKLSDPTHLLYKSESGKDILQIVRAKIAT